MRAEHFRRHRKCPCSSTCVDRVGVGSLRTMASARSRCRFAPMAHYPPPPPGGGFPPAATPPDPYAHERALAEWARQRGYFLSPAADLAWYRAWAPFSFLFPIQRVGRELRMSAGEAMVWVVEAFEGDAVKEVAGEDRHLTCFLTSPKLAYRAAIRSKSTGGLVSELSRGLDDLFGSPKPAVGGVIGDPAFEARFDVAVPTREEASAALTMPLRQQLLQGGFRGVLELRAGGLVCAMFDRPGFDPVSLDGTLAWFGQIYRAATQYPHAVTPPP